ncbi:GNAT family N-acetyltransferase [Pedobacter sp. MW01-1-1]|uniref:GNAT family N-acetyltransferase n=1 Tax=Pedobacter sp. MW01-1-1 TaxID=3383027 RepID=UPI003FED4492
MSTLNLLRTNSNNQDFRALVVLLDDFLSEIDGKEHAFYAQFNKIDLLNEVIVAYIKNEPVACGAFKAFDEETVEIKRMFVQADYRNYGIATQVLQALENWAQEQGFKFCVLETGLRQEAAIAVYKKANYHIIPNYGQYAGIENSVCMKKALNF